MSSLLPIPTKPFHRRLAASTALLAAWLVVMNSPSPARAHEGHDHGAPVLATPNLPTQPRLVALGDEFELVGVLSPDRLSFYLDDSKSNAPIDGAKLEIYSAAGTPSTAISGTATAQGAGTYVLPLKAPLAVGKYALTLSIETPDSSDLLSATLDVAPASAPSLAGATGGGRAFSSFLTVGTAGGALVLLAGLAGFFYARRQGLFRVGK